MLSSGAPVLRLTRERRSDIWVLDIQIREERVVRRMCAWCGKALGTKEPSNDPGVTSTICGGCADRLLAYRKPVLVVSREWARLFDELVEMLKDRPEIEVVLDRRDPTEGERADTGWNGPDRRRGRQPFSLE